MGLDDRCFRFEAQRYFPYVTPYRETHRPLSKILYQVYLHPARFLVDRMPTTVTAKEVTVLFSFFFHSPPGLLLSELELRSFDFFSSSKTMFTEEGGPPFFQLFAALMFRRHLVPSHYVSSSFFE